jgi:hypothetical protein
MGKIHAEIDESLKQFIAHQPMFFVASAPLAGDGHINLSPKGLDTFRVLGPRTVAYLDLTGSGIETVAHVKENGRLVIMFCAFAGPPKILRLYGRAEVIEPGHAEFTDLRAQFPSLPGARSIIRLSVDRIADSCGYGVPVLELKEPRTQLTRWAEKKSANELDEYQRLKNERSVDGLPGLAPRD